MKKRDHIFDSSPLRSVVRTGSYAAGIFILVLIFSSCPNPILQSMVDQAKDINAPDIRITSPAEGGLYASSVTIIGTVTDSASDNGSTGQVNTLSYHITGTEINVDVPFDEEGNFIQSIDMKEYSGEKEIVFAATDWNGNSSDYTLTLTDDGSGPHIAISSPSNQDYYASTVIVAGTVANSPDDSGLGEIKSLSYEVLSSAVGGDLTFPSGSFSFQFETGALNGNLVVRLTATDWNRNETKLDLVLLDGGSGIPTLEAQAGDSMVTLTWDEVTLAESYTLYYTANGSLPSENYGTRIDDVTSPCTLTSLENGALYVFKLQAVSASGEDNWSDYCRAIPLSPYTLAPKVSGEYGRMRIEWPSIAASDNFQIWRASAKNGNYIRISDTTSRNEYYDSDVQTGATYWYRIRPAEYSETLSVPDSGETDPFPVNQIVASLYSQNSTDVFTAGNYLFAADYSEGLKIIDISDPSSPVLVKTVSSGITNAACVVVDGGYAYVAGQFKDLYIVDIGTPENASVINTVEEVAAPFGIAVSNGYVYIADQSTVKVVDIDPPETASVVHSITTNAYDIALSGNYAYVSYGSGTRVIDISDPPNASIVHTVAGSNSYGIDISGTYAYTTMRSSDPNLSGLQIIDISDPLNASEVSTLTAGITNPAGNGGVFAAGDYVYLSDAPISGESGVRVIDVSDPSNPSVVQTIAASSPDNTVVSGNYAYVADSAGGLVVADLAAPYRTTVESYITSISQPSSIALQGDYAFVATYNSGYFFTADLTIPARTGIILFSGDDAYDVEIVGNHAFIAQGANGLQIADISDPDNPEEAGSLSLSDARGVDIFGALAAVADNGVGIQFANVSDPLNPSVIKTVSTPDARKAVIDGSYVYVADGSGGFKVINITSIQSAAVIASTATSGTANSLAVSGSYAYIADGTAGLCIIDISNPANPSIAAVLALTDTAYDIAVSGKYAYVADYSGGLQIINVENPADPSVLHTIPTSEFLGTGNYARGIAVSGNRAVIADYGQGIQIVELWPF